MEAVIKDYRDDVLLAIDECQWELLFDVMQQQSVKGESDYQSLLRSMYLFKYRDPVGRWFGISPALAETEKVLAWRELK